jgi:hypothetical protein
MLINIGNTTVQIGIVTEYLIERVRAIYIIVQGGKNQFLKTIVNDKFFSKSIIKKIED